MTHETAIESLREILAFVGEDQKTPLGNVVDVDWMEATVKIIHLASLVAAKASEIKLD